MQVRCRGRIPAQKAAAWGIHTQRLAERYFDLLLLIHGNENSRSRLSYNLSDRE